jgi:hypothetical protein
MEIQDPQDTNTNFNNQLPQGSVSATPDEELRRQRLVTIGIISVLIFLVIVFVATLIYLLNPNTSSEQVARIRDVFIIILALQSLFIGFVLVILIIQIARLTNLIQNEIPPILDSTNETVSTLRGTTQFLSDNITEPVIKLNEYLAGFYKFIELLGLTKKK